MTLRLWLFAYDLTAHVFGWASPANLWVLRRVSDATQWEGTDG